MPAESFLDHASVQVNKNIAARNYWKERMKGFEQAACFTGNKVAVSQGLSRGEYCIAADTAIYQSLKEMAASGKARHIVLLQALAVLLHKYGSCPDLVVLTPVHNRREGANSDNSLLPVRMNNLDNPSFRESVLALKNNLAEDMRHCDYPLAKKLSVKEEELGSWPLVGFLLEDFQSPEVFWHLDMLFSCNTEAGLLVKISYDADRYDEAYIARVARHYLQLLEKLVADKDQPMRDIELISATEKALILDVFNNTEHPFPSAKTIMHLFSEQVALYPNNMAISCLGKEMSYRELQYRSDRVARRLVEKFPEKGTVVAIKLDRSLELMIAVFGILKAGCIYLPLSKDYPAERITYVLEDSGAQLVFTDAAETELAGICCCKVADMADDDDVSGAVVTARVNRATPGDTAYIIYTSGSTGQPKGVPIRHCSVVNRLNWMQEQYGLQAGDVILQKTPVVFDVSVWELFWASLQGAKLVLAPPGAEKDPVALGKLIETEKISVLHFVPSMLQVFLQVKGGGHATESIRYVFTSGEELKIKEVQLFHACCPTATLHNLYGPTEATVDVSYYPVTESMLPTTGEQYRIPIGKPIHNTSLYIFNGYGQLQPVGATGELCIGGINLSAGYLNKAALTQEKFIPNPLDPAMVIYKTGDLARWLPDGNIEFLGRIDSQVKVRGNRIELGEIELAIAGFATVQRTVVLTKNAGADTQLVAYVQHDGLFSEEALRKYLEAKLPHYMLPDLIISVADMPLTVNGKIDRKALLLLSRTETHAYVAPVTTLEKTLAAAWQKVLGMERPGVHDRFFRVGGDSILAVRLIGLINKELPVRLSMSNLLEHDSIAQLARLINTTETIDPAVEDALMMVTQNVEQFDLKYKTARQDKAGAAAIEAAYPMSDIETGMCFIHLSNPEDILYFEQNVIPIDYEVLDFDMLRKAVGLMVKKHPILRTAFDLGTYAHVVYREPVIELSYHDLSSDSREDQKKQIGEYLEQSRLRHFDISKLPLWRMVIYRLGEHYHVMVLEAHHAILDGWSHAALVTELNNTYGELLRNPAFRPAPLEITYKDHIIEELVRKQDSRTLDFWKKEMDGFKKLELTARAGDKSFTSIKKGYDSGLMAKLENVALKRNIPVKHLFFAAHVYALKMLTGVNDIVTGLVSFSRPLAKDGDKLLGCFLTTVPVRVIIPEACNWNDYLQLVHTKMQETAKYDGLSFFEISQAIGVKVENINPLFDTMFNFINFHVIKDFIPEQSVKEEQDDLGFANYLRDESLFSVSMHANNEGIKAKYDYSGSCLNEASFQSFLHYYEESISVIADGSDAVLAGEMDLLAASERVQLLDHWNATELWYDESATIVSMFKDQANRTPGKTAVVYEGKELSYAELEEQSDKVGLLLREQYGVRGGKLVGMMLGRSEQLLVGLLGILKSGGAYVPLDPTYPRERLLYMLQDSGAGVLLVDKDPGELPGFSGKTVELERLLATKAVPARVEAAIHSEDLCYVIYTSGSTGHPKGVMISHGNVVNFFAGINDRIRVKEGDRLLAVTSTSFDISVLELFWTLCHGVEVVLHPADISLNGLDRYVEDQKLDFSLFFFSSYEKDQQGDKYKLLLESVKYADQAGFNAVWTPERHFHEFGGLYPNPSVISAALSMVTSRIALRSGSVVSPLHDTIRIAEDWSVVDNLSGGRVGLSFASGWNPDDFVLAPELYAKRQQKMYEQIEEVRKLWRGEELRRINGLGHEVGVKIYPRPLQAELPVWVTSAGNAETFRSAGKAGANILTHLLGQDLEMLKENIGLYRAARKAGGYDGGQVTIMLHTYIGENEQEVEQLVEAPFTAYLESSIGLNRVIFEEAGFKLEELTEELRKKVLRNAFLRYYKTGSLIGTRSSCGRVLEQLREIGVNEIACLVDFGVAEGLVLEGLKRLNEVRELHTGRGRVGKGGITLLQSTPSFMRMVEEGRGSARFLGSLRALLLGGEAVPLQLVKRLQEGREGLQVYNMYGPTETTIWSCMHQYAQGEEKMSIGSPLGNEQVYILDESRRLLPVGVTGELYIGGKGLSKGYWGRGELTAERFVENPYRVGEKLYRTGDLARWQGGGKLEFVGRKDQQVKVRGYRIELGEIESRMQGYEQVSEAVVVVWEGGEGDKVLVGYVVSKELVDEGGLRKYLQAYLPHYMIPGHIVQLDKLPLTLNGKIDRKALVIPGARKKQEYAGPANKTEEKLVTIWSELLQLDKERIDTDKSFFDIGGHSLKAALLLNLILKEFRVEIPLNEFFKHQSIVQLAKYIEQAERTYYISIRKALRKEYYKLSSAQRRLFFVHELDRRSVAYNMPYVAALEGQLDEERLEMSFRKLVERHESLRTSFVMADGEPVQQIAAQADFSIARPEYTGGDMQKAIKAFVRPFELGKAPLMRVGLVKEAADRHILIVDMPHIISDGVSQYILIKDFLAFYNNETPPPLRLHYKDYAEWEQSAEQQDEIRKQRDFWLDQFSEIPEMLQLPTDFARSAAKNYQGGWVGFSFNGGETEKLRALAEAEGSTMYTILLSVYSILLSKLGGAEDIVIGTSTAGRQHADLNKVMGMFVNTLPLRTYPSGDITYTEFLQEVRSLTLACFDQQSYPYEGLIDELKLERDISRNPLFDCMFAYEHLEASEAGLAGLSVKTYESGHRMSKFDLTLSVSETPEGLQMGFEYASELFKEETIARFVAYLKRIVTAVIADRDTTLSAISILPEEELLWLDELNKPGAPVIESKGQTVLSLIEKQVLQTPDRIAVACGQEAISYAQLWTLSDKIGRYLRQQGLAGSGDLVGVLMGRELNLAAVLLGIWKAGAAYLPIDLHYPKDRIIGILSDSAVKTVITSGPLLAAEAAGIEIIHLEDILPALDQAADMEPETVLPGELAYVLYTSGSTGRPKGVMIAHGSLLNYINWAADYYLAGKPGIFPLFTSVSFDLTLTSLFVPLISGGKMQVYGEEEMGILLEKIMSNEDLNCIKLTPSHLRIINELGLKRPGAGLGIHTWIVGGEDLETAVAQAIVEQFGSDTKIYNEYGPTEATVGCMIYQYQGTEPGLSIPIGRPVQQTQLYVLDKYLHRVPVGVEGELFVGGAGLAIGYLNRSALTAEKFVQVNGVQERLYRTGDLAVVRSDGNLLFRGRKDDQVKLRGYRIELGEISSRLCCHDEVIDAVVVLREIGGEKTLVAYYTGDAEEKSLRHWLQERLPGYMLPAYYCRVDRLPVTANGKKDVKRLPPIERGNAGKNEAPSNELEQRLVDIWSELLELEPDRISVNKSFFELGGHSLKAISMVNRIFVEWDVDIPLEEVFNKETILNIAQYIANERWVKNTTAAERVGQDEFILE